jgi:hypothetical protein
LLIARKGCVQTAAVRRADLFAAPAATCKNVEQVNVKSIDQS